MTQEWCCERCGSNGSVSIADNADVMTGVHAVVTDHERLSPACASTRHLRVRHTADDQRWELAKRRAQQLAKATSTLVRV